MTLDTIAMLLSGTLIAGVLAVRPIPTRELRFRWRYQKVRVTLVGLLTLLGYAAGVDAADYVLRHSLTSPPSGWLLRGLIASGVITVVLRFDAGSLESPLGPIEQPGLTEARSLARELSRRMYEIVDDATREDVQGWVRRKARTYQVTALLTDAVYQSLPQEIRVEQDLVMARQKDLEQTQPAALRRDAQMAIHVWASDAICRAKLMLAPRWYRYHT